MHGPEFWSSEHHYNPKHQRGRNGCKYTPQEDADIMEQMDTGKPIAEIAGYHKRSIKAVELRVQHITTQLTKKLVGEQKVDAADISWPPAQWRADQMKFILASATITMKELKKRFGPP
jgi:hypothetical protein